jgi:hypothetical protein
MLQYKWTSLELLVRVDFLLGLHVHEYNYHDKNDLDGQVGCRVIKDDDKV